jgi:hypothetical protein
MKFLEVAVILAIVSVLLVSSPVGLTIDLENAGPVPAAGAKPVVSRSGSEVQRSVEENRDKRAALGFLLLLRMFGDAGRH